MPLLPELSKSDQKPEEISSLRQKMWEIIFEAETKEGKLFDVVLLIMIFLSIILVMLETIPTLDEQWRDMLWLMEWVITIFFTFEYFLRLYCVRKPLNYAKSFFGIIDLIAIIPSYLSFIFPGAHSLMIVRGLRLLRVFRIFKLNNFLQQGNVLIEAFRASRTKISLFIFFVLLMVSIFGSIMFLIEHNVNAGFDSIPRSIYWSIVTLTTVGYGDISPITPLGQFLASVVMITGYAVIAVPTGIMTSAIMEAHHQAKLNTNTCPECHLEGHDNDAIFCRKCGSKL
ncbi:MAG: ion transporter [Saprospiraceae bacterium]|nr:ion transporter [Saprospiraceae bacterium]